MGFQRIDDELSVIRKFQAEDFETCHDFLPFDTGSEVAAFEFFPDTFRGQCAQAFGPHQGAGDDETSQLIAGDQCAAEECVMGDLPLGVMGGDGVRDLLFSQISKSCDDPIGVLFGPGLVVCIVEESCGTPLVIVFAVLGGEGAHDEFDAPSMPKEAVALGHFFQNVGSGFAVHVSTA